MPPIPVPHAFALAVQLHQAGRLPEAEALYRQILAVQPQHPDATHLLGVIAHQAGDHEAGIAMIRRAIALQPQNPFAHSNLGEAYRTIGRFPEALSAIRRSLELDPSFADAHSNLGIVLTAQGELAAAAECFRRAIALKPEYAQAHSNLGNVLQEQEFYDEAMACYHQSLALQPDYPEASNNLGNVLRKQGRHVEAIASYRRALGQFAHSAPTPRGPPATPAVIHENRTTSQPSLESHPSRYAAYSALLLLLHYTPDLAPSAILEEQRRWNRCVCEPLRLLRTPHTNDRDPARRLRIGYVSADFRDHVVGRNLRPLFRNHDHRQFEIFCYSSVAQPDGITADFRHHSDAWLDIVRLDHDALAARIRHDKIDLLIDLGQHTAGNRLSIFARQPAPVQVSFAGYPAGTGLETIPWRIADRWLESTAENAPLDLPSSRRATEPPNPASRPYLLDSFWCYDPCGIELPVNDLPANTQRFLTFGSLNDFSKINDSVLHLWARILAQVPRSRLLLLTGFGQHRRRTADLFAEAGIASDRLEFVERRPRCDYLALYHRLDLVLDPFPYGGHTTSLDALWMGVPFITLPGPTAVSRGGLSILRNLGLPELIASSADDYVRLAVEFAHNPNRLAALRQTLRPRLESSVLMDAPHFTRQVEAAYHAMWLHWITEGNTCPSTPVD